MAGPDAAGRSDGVTGGPSWRGNRRLVVGLLCVIVLAWAWLLVGAGLGMGALAMTSMAAMDGWLMAPAVWSPRYAVLMFGMWWVMMAAMMLPTAMPVLLLYVRVAQGRPGGRSPGYSPGVWMAVGYLLVWGGFSLAATAIEWALEATRLLSPMMQVSHRGLGAAILILAGTWQLTPVKRDCLRHCQSPLGFVAGHWRDGRSGALRMGLRHGVYCLGCCWSLMLLLFLGGVMNLYWIVGLMLFILLEKSAVAGHWFSRASGLGLLAWGFWLALRTG